MANGDGATSSSPTGVERASGPFRAEQVRDPDLPQPICRFLAIAPADGPFIPATRLDTANRCISNAEPLAQSGRQQELVCLTAAHVNCPRFLRGVLIADAPPPPPAREPIAPAVIGATLVLIAALAASFGFLAVRGGFNLPIASAAPAVVAIAGSPTPSSIATPLATPAPSPSIAASPSPSERAAASPSPEPTPTAAPLPTATPTPAPTPTRRTATPTPGGGTSDRYAVLTKCPSTPDCWIYVIRAGDNLQSIAHWFGVSYNRMLDMNPNLRIPIHAGDHLRIPTPTR